MARQGGGAAEAAHSSDAAAGRLSSAQQRQQQWQRRTATEPTALSRSHATECRTHAASGAASRNSDRRGRTTRSPQHHAHSVRSSTSRRPADACHRLPRAGYLQLLNFHLQTRGPNEDLGPDSISTRCPRWLFRTAKTVSFREKSRTKQPTLNQKRTDCQCLLHSRA